MRPKLFICYQICTVADTWLRRLAEKMSNVGTVGGLIAAISAIANLLSWAALARMLAVWCGLYLLLHWAGREFAKINRQVAKSWLDYAKNRCCWWCSAPKLSERLYCPHCGKVYLENLTIEPDF